MAKLHIFIDGTWLFRICGAGKVMANKTEDPSNTFRLDFKKFNSALLNHVRQKDSRCDALGDLYLSISIFEPPKDIDNWPDRFSEFSSSDIERVKRAIKLRENFLKCAIESDYKKSAVYYPPLKEWTLRKFLDDQYREKMVDTTVVALLVRSAITNRDDFHLIMTGDSDVVPAIKLAYPEYTKNIVIGTSHPDELLPQHRESSFSFMDFTFDIEPFYLQDHVQEIISGDNVYVCANCNKVFVRAKSIPTKARPYCGPCLARRKA